MPNAVLRTQLAGVARRPSRLLLTGLAVLVVSFVVFGTVLARQITERTILEHFSGTPQAVDVVAYGPVTTGQEEKIGRLDGIDTVYGRAEGIAAGITVTADPGQGPFATTEVREGRYPLGPGEVAVTPRTATRLGLTIGSTIKGTRLTVVGTVTGRNDFGFQAYAPQTTVTALRGDDQLDRVDVRVRPGVDPSVMSGRIQALLGPDASVTSGAAARLSEAEDAASGVRSLFAIITMFVAIAVVAAALVTTSTFRIVFAQRMRQIALLRAVGAGRGSIVRSLAAEGALTGLVTGVAGVLLALGTGFLLPLVVPGLAFPAVPVAPAIEVVLLAVALTTVAVLAPAASASRVSPLEALRGSSTTTARTGVGKLRWAAGLLMAGAAVQIAAYVATRLPGPDAKDYHPNGNLLLLVTSGGLAFFALVALGPVLVRPVLTVLGGPVRRSGPVGRLAAGGVGAAPRRAAAVSVVVALGVTLIAGTLIGGASLRVAVDREAAIGAPADFNLHPTGNAPITAAMTDRLRARSELTNVTPYRSRTVRIGGSDVDAVDLDFAAVPALRKLDLPRPTPGHVVLSAFAAGLTGADVGNTITVTPAAQLEDPTGTRATQPTSPEPTPSGSPSGAPPAASGSASGAQPTPSGSASTLQPTPGGSASGAEPTSSRSASVGRRTASGSASASRLTASVSSSNSAAPDPSASAGRAAVNGSASTGHSAAGGSPVAGQAVMTGAPAGAGQTAAATPGGPAVGGQPVGAGGATSPGDRAGAGAGGAQVPLTVVAVLPDATPLGADLAVDPGDLTRMGAGDAYAGMLADAAGRGEPGRDLGRAAMDQVQAAEGGKWTVDVLADGRDQMAGTVTLLVTVALGLVGLTVLVAVVGVGTTAALSVVERVGEAGLLRAVGLSRAGLRAMLTVESALYGVIGSGLGLALGVPYAWLAVKALGVSAPVSFPPGRLAAVVVALPLLTALAGVLPARRAAKLSPVEVTV
ncbi:FtsX-like permease family protein [Actinoplanes sp. NPDC051411]|uniref:FtsX-like permease family protein n=1 Tax=Actinoplanes sp. NPDC051411 TaxID=3155522 RepID=UPI00342D7A73